MDAHRPSGGSARLEGVSPDVDHARAGPPQLPPGPGHRRGPEVPGQTRLPHRQHSPCGGLLRGALLLAAQAGALPRLRERGVHQVPRLLPGTGGALGLGRLPERLGCCVELLVSGGLSTLRAQGLLPACQREGTPGSAREAAAPSRAPAQRAAREVTQEGPLPTQGQGARAQPGGQAPGGAGALTPARARGARPAQPLPQLLVHPQGAAQLALQGLDPALILPPAVGQPLPEVV